MNFKIQTKEGVVNYTPDQLIKHILAVYNQKLDKNPEAHKDIDAMVYTLGQSLQARGALTDMKIDDLIHAGMVLGYYHRVFLEKNEVEMEFENGSTSSDRSE